MRSEIADKILNETPEEVKIFADWYGDLVVLLHHILDQKDLSQKDLADGLGKRPSEVNKWLNGDHNFTLRSLAKLQAELGENILTIPSCKPIKHVEGRKKTMMVYRNRKVKIADSSYNSHWKKAQNNAKQFVNAS